MDTPDNTGSLENDVGKLSVREQQSSLSHSESSLSPSPSAASSSTHLPLPRQPGARRPNGRTGTATPTADTIGPSSSSASLPLSTATTATKTTADGDGPGSDVDHLKPPAVAAKKSHSGPKPSKPTAASSRRSGPSQSPPALLTHLDDKTAEACASFKLISESIYASKQLGQTDHALDCDCSSERDSATGINTACGEDSDCINRATKMECHNECGCGPDCQNQRFQQKEYADVSVIEAGKKGYGLRTNVGLEPHQFIFEYIGEVINEASFRKRMAAYDHDGIRHFYFMSLSRGEFVDATRKGNLGRFINHSCNPNCYVDKWVVGQKLRMGIFASRSIRPGEELVFNYNVDRYGADPQPCYCADAACIGFIGGRTQTDDRSDDRTKLSGAVIDALGTDSLDGRTSDLGEGSVTNVMATLMQSREKWIVAKLLARLQGCDDDRVLNKVAKMHGYQILKSVLSAWMTDSNVALQVLDVLMHLPRLTRNKIQDSNIEQTVRAAIDATSDDRIRDAAAGLLDVWSKLEVGYRIPLLRRDSSGPGRSQSPKPVSTYSDRRGRQADSPSRQRTRRQSLSPHPFAPSGPRASRGMGGGNNGPVPPSARSRVPKLPPGWFSAYSDGHVYFYDLHGTVTWEMPRWPTQPPGAGPMAPTSNRSISAVESDKLDAIIQSIIRKKSDTNSPAVSSSAAAGPTTQADNQQSQSQPHQQAASLPATSGRSDRWRSWPVEKQMKVYENTLSPAIRHVMNKYTSKLPRDDLKRFGKEIAKKLVASDYKNGRVTDPTRMTDKQQHLVRAFVRDFFDKAVVKRQAMERRKRPHGTAHQDVLAAYGRAKSPTEPVPADVRQKYDKMGLEFGDRSGAGSGNDHAGEAQGTAPVEMSDYEVDDDDDYAIDDNDGDDHHHFNTQSRKRKQSADPDRTTADPDQSRLTPATPVKRVRTEQDGDEQDVNFLSSRSSRAGSSPTAGDDSRRDQDGRVTMEKNGLSNGIEAA